MQVRCEVGYLIPVMFWSRNLNENRPLRHRGHAGRDCRLAARQRWGVLSYIDVTFKFVVEK